jgi:hypothetical protein
MITLSLSPNSKPDLMMTQEQQEIQQIKQAYQKKRKKIKTIKPVKGSSPKSQPLY